MHRIDSNTLDIKGLLCRLSAPHCSFDLATSYQPSRVASEFLYDSRLPYFSPFLPLLLLFCLYVRRRVKKATLSTTSHNYQRGHGRPTKRRGFKERASSLCQSSSIILFSHPSSRANARSPNMTFAVGPPRIPPPTPFDDSGQ